MFSRKHYRSFLEPNKQIDNRITVLKKIWVGLIQHSWDICEKTWSFGEDKCHVPNRWFFLPWILFLLMLPFFFFLNFSPFPDFFFLLNNILLNKKYSFPRFLKCGWFRSECNHYRTSKGGCTALMGRTGGSCVPFKTQPCKSYNISAIWSQPHSTDILNP